MLNVTVKSHRPYLRADAGLQKLFVMLKMAPPADAATARPRLDLTLVLDTSGSMRERAPGLEAPPEESPPAGLVDKLLHLVRPGSSKLDVATEAARRLVQSPHLRTEDTVSIIQFDDSSTVLATGRAGADRAVARSRRSASAIQRRDPDGARPAERPARGDVSGARAGLPRRSAARGPGRRVHCRRGARRLGRRRGDGIRAAAQCGQPRSTGDGAGGHQSTASGQDAPGRPKHDPATRQPRHDRCARPRGRELRGNGTISVGTRKTIKVGARTQTMKGDGPDATPQNVPSQDEIRRLTGA